MIIFSRRAKREILLEFDSKGCEDLLSVFREINNVSFLDLSVEFEMSIIKNKYIGKTVSSIAIGVDDVVDGAEMSFDGEKIIWKMDKEYACMSLGRFIECDKNKDFFPAEFMYVQVLGRKYSDFVFCRWCPE